MDRHEEPSLPFPRIPRVAPGYARRMRSFLLRPRVVLVALVAPAPFVAGGACGDRTACFTYTPAEYALHHESCPAREDALPNFSDPSCPGPVVSVDGAGTFDGQLCCYPVTYDDVVPDCGNH